MSPPPIPHRERDHWSSEAHGDITPSSGLGEVSGQAPDRIQEQEDGANDSIDLDGD
jgi:hypothetical protein